MPIRFDLGGDLPRRNEYMRNVGEGGLCFATLVALDPGLPIRLRIPVFGEQFEVDGTMTWCRLAGRAYEVGVAFQTPQDQFCVRMVEQLLYIDDYRSEVERREGRTLSPEQAAAEWVERFADKFPALH